MKAITVFHYSKCGKYLVEVKRYAVFWAAKQWARKHPAAFVYARVEVGREAAPLWFEFMPYRGIPNLAWRRLASKDIERLPELLEGS